MDFQSLSSPVLALYDMNREINVCMEISYYELGCVLLQELEGSAEASSLNVTVSLTDRAEIRTGGKGGIGTDLGL